MSITKSIRKFEYKFDLKAEQFIWHHPLLGFFLLFKANDVTEDEVRAIIEKCTDGRFLGLFGEETVNVLKVNLMLDGILEE